MITKPSNIGRWIGAAIATIILVAVSFVGFRAFNARAHAHTELQSGAQSPHSDTAAQSGSQSGDTPQSAQPTPVDVPKPTPPPNLYAGGQIGAQATSQWYIDLWAYAFNTGDTEDFMTVCQNDDYCTRVNNDVQALHADRIVTRPITIKYLMTKEIWTAHLRQIKLAERALHSTFPNRVGQPFAKTMTQLNLTTPPSPFLRRVIKLSTITKAPCCL